MGWVGSWEIAWKELQSTLIQIPNNDFFLYISTGNQIDYYWKWEILHRKK